LDGLRVRHVIVIDFKKQKHKALSRRPMIYVRKVFVKIGQQDQSLKGRIITQNTKNIFSQKSISFFFKQKSATESYQ
jgi:hypothetical protein